MNIVEKILFMAVSYFLLIFVSFSFFTGRFPPRKDDFSKAAVLMKQLITSKNDLKNEAAVMQGNSSPSLEQIANYQRLSLKLTEVTIELTQVFKKMQGLSGPGNPAIAAKLQQANENLAASEKLLTEVGSGLQQGIPQ